MNYQTIKLNGGAEVYLDLDQKRTKCKKCDTMLYFGLTKNNKSMPIEQMEDGTYESHFANCKFANDFRKNKSKFEESISNEEENQDELNNL